MTNSRINRALIRANSSSNPIIFNTSLLLTTSMLLIFATLNKLVNAGNFEALYAPNNVSEGGTWIRVQHSDEYPFDDIPVDIRDCNMIVATSPNNTAYKNISDFIECFWGNQQGPTTEFFLQQGHNFSLALVKCLDGLLNYICDAYNRIHHPPHPVPPSPNPDTSGLSILWPIAFWAGLFTVCCVVFCVAKCCCPSSVNESTNLVSRSSSHHHHHSDSGSGATAAIGLLGLLAGAASSSSSSGASGGYQGVSGNDNNHTRTVFHMNSNVV